MAWKYVMLEVTLGERQNPADTTRIRFPVIFPDKIVHDMMVEGMKAVLAAHGMKAVEAVSAGTIEHIETEGLGGDSETLGISSNPEDERIIDMYSYFHGIVGV